MSRILFSFVLVFVLAGCGGAVALDNTNNPNCIHQITHEPGAWLLSTPNIRFVFWGQYWNNFNKDAVFYVSSGREQDAYQLVWQQLIHKGVFDRLAEYGVESALLDPYNYDTNQFGAAVSSVDDTKIADELNSEILNGQLPVPDDQSVFVIFLPPNVLTPNMAKNGWAGYHSSAHYGNIKYVYAVIEYSSYDTNSNEFFYTNIHLSHELYEAFTDPDTSTGYFDRNTTNEIGDLCFPHSTIISGAEQVQSVWSQGACRCL